MRKKVRRKTILIDGIRYYDDKPDTCRKCFFWKNRKVGCVLGTQNCYYLAEAVKTEQEKKCEGCCYAKGHPCVSAVCYKELDAWLRAIRANRAKEAGAANAEVLYPKSIYDLIDYYLREWIRREQKMRVCKNCGKYFAITGRTNAEYCDRVFDSKGRTCKDVGAIAKWTREKDTDDVFKAYRREYKKRFAWTKSGKILPEELYAWGERAREKKAECDSGKITLEEYTTWLKES